MASNWSFISAAGGRNLDQTTLSVAVTIAPQAGDLICVSLSGHRTGTAEVLDATTPITDNIGTAGWNQVGTTQTTTTLLIGAAWTKVATGAETSVTVKCSGGTGTINNSVSVEVFRVAPGLEVTAIIDTTAVNKSNSAGTTQTWSPGSGSTHSSFTDALAWTTFGSGASASGGPTGTNKFQNTDLGSPNFSPLTTAFGANNGHLCDQYFLGVQASSTAGHNNFVNTWTNSVSYTVVGLTAVYQSIGVSQVAATFGASIPPLILPGTQVDGTFLATGGTPLELVDPFSPLPGVFGNFVASMGEGLSIQSSNWSSQWYFVAGGPAAVEYPGTFFLGQHCDNQINSGAGSGHVNFTRTPQVGQKLFTGVVVYTGNNSNPTIHAPTDDGDPSAVWTQLKTTRTIVNGAVCAIFYRTVTSTDVSTPITKVNHSWTGSSNVTDGQMFVDEYDGFGSAGVNFDYSPATTTQAASNLVTSVTTGDGSAPIEQPELSLLFAFTGEAGGISTPYFAVYNPLFGVTNKYTMNVVAEASNHVRALRGWVVADGDQYPGVAVTNLFQLGWGGPTAGRDITVFNVTIYDAPQDAPGQVAAFFTSPNFVQVLEAFSQVSATFAMGGLGPEYVVPIASSGNQVAGMFQALSATGGGGAMVLGSSASLGTGVALGNPVNPTSPLTVIPNQQGGVVATFSASIPTLVYPLQQSQVNASFSAALTPTIYVNPSGVAATFVASLTPTIYTLPSSVSATFTAMLTETIYISPASVAGNFVATNVGPFTYILDVGQVDGQFVATGPPPALVLDTGQVTATFSAGMVEALVLDVGQVVATFAAALTPTIDLGVAQVDAFFGPSPLPILVLVSVLPVGTVDGEFVGGGALPLITALPGGQVAGQFAPFIVEGVWPAPFVAGLSATFAAGGTVNLDVGQAQVDATFVGAGTAPLILTIGIAPGEIVATFVATGPAPAIVEVALGQVAGAFVATSVGPIDLLITAEVDGNFLATNLVPFAYGIANEVTGEFIAQSLPVVIVLTDVAQVAAFFTSPRGIIRLPSPATFQRVGSLSSIWRTGTVEPISSDDGGEFSSEALVISSVWTLQDLVVKL